MNQSFTPNDVTSDDKLWALLAYILTPLVPIIILLWEEKKNRPFLKAHNMQALILGAAEIIISGILSVISLGVLGCIFGIIVLVVNIFYGVKAYRGETFDLPFISNFVRQQGW